jgi:hypothetical protein
MLVLSCPCSSCKWWHFLQKVITLSLLIGAHDGIFWISMVMKFTFFYNLSMFFSLCHELFHLVTNFLFLFNLDSCEFIFFLAIVFFKTIIFFSFIKCFDFSQVLNLDELDGCLDDLLDAFY